MKTIIKLIVLGAFLTGCGADPFAILNDEDYDYNGKASELQKYIVTRDVKLEELVGTWKVDEASKEKYLKVFGISNFFYVSDKEKEERKELDESYVLVKKDGFAKFKVFTERKGKARITNHNKALSTYGRIKEGIYLNISYRKESSWGDKNYDYLKVDGIFYLGERYQKGDLDAGNLKKYYLLYKKVNSGDNNESK